MFVLLSEVGLKAKNLKNGVTWAGSRSTKNSAKKSAFHSRFDQSFEYKEKHRIV